MNTHPQVRGRWQGVKKMAEYPLSAGGERGHGGFNMNLDISFRRSPVSLDNWGNLPGSIL